MLSIWSFKKQHVLIWSKNGKLCNRSFVQRWEDEIDDFERMTDEQIDSDVLPASTISGLQKFLESEGLLE